MGKVNFKGRARRLIFSSLITVASYHHIMLWNQTVVVCTLLSPVRTCQKPRMNTMNPLQEVDKYSVSPFFPGCTASNSTGGHLQYCSVKFLLRLQCYVQVLIEKLQLQKWTLISCSVSLLTILSALEHYSCFPKNKVQDYNNVCHR